MSPTPLFLTVASVNYLPFVRVLAESLQKEIPTARLSVLITDVSRNLLSKIAEKFGRPGMEFMCCEDLGAEFVVAMRDYYSILEFNSACKALGLYHHIIRRDEAECFFIDPDMYVTGDFVAAARTAGPDIVLTRHSYQPYPDDGELPSEKELALSGHANGGFIYVRKSAESMKALEWLMQQTRYNWFVAPTYGMYADQHWLAALPHFFQGTAGFLANTGVNIAYWNLHERPLRYKEGVIYAGEVPALLFHFSGFSVPSGGKLSRHSNRKFDATTEKMLAELIPLYEKLLIREQTYLKETGLEGDLRFSAQALPVRLKAAASRWGYRYAELAPVSGFFSRIGKILDRIFG